MPKKRRKKRYSNPKDTPHVKTGLERRRVIVADMYIRGHTQQEISQFVQVSQPTIVRDLKAVRVEWRKSMAESWDDLVGRELAKLDKIEQKAWAAWERSCMDAVQRKTTFESAEGKPKKEVTRKGQCGDPRYLEAVRHCVERRCKLLGLDQQSEEAAVPNAAVVEVVVKTREDAHRILEMQEFDRMKRVGGAPPAAMPPPLTNGNGHSGNGHSKGNGKPPAPGPNGNGHPK